MSDTLPVLSTDALTVAVTSLLKRPLPDNDQIPIIKGTCTMVAKIVNYLVCLTRNNIYPAHNVKMPT